MAQEIYRKAGVVQSTHAQANGEIMIVPSERREVRGPDGQPVPGQFQFMSNMGNYTLPAAVAPRAHEQIRVIVEVLSEGDPDYVAGE
jgi:hypothetical protein